MREGRKKEASKIKQTTRQSNTREFYVWSSQVQCYQLVGQEGLEGLSIYIEIGGNASLYNMKN